LTIVPTWGVTGGGATTYRKATAVIRTFMSIGMLAGGQGGNAGKNGLPA